MKEATRIRRTIGLRNSRLSLFSFGQRAVLRCFCAMGIYSSSILVVFWPFLRQEPKSTRQPQSAEIIKFELDQEGSRYGKARTRVSFSRFKAGDGVTVERRIQTYPSLSAAQDEMASMVQSANKIIARTPQRDPQGTVMGERFTLAYTHTESKEPRYVVLWKDRKVLHVLESISLRHVLAFETQMGPQAGSTKGDVK